MAAFLNACRFNPAAGGTADWTYSSPVPGYQSPLAAGAVNGRSYKYRAESADLSQWELGEGSYNSGTGTFARTTVLFNSSGTSSKINFSSVPQVAIVALKEDLISIEESSSFTTAQKNQARTNINAASLDANIFSSSQIALEFIATGGNGFYTSTSSAGPVGVVVSNSHSGASALAGISLAANVNTGSNLRVYSSGRGTYVNLAANVLALYTAHTAGMAFLVDANGPMTWAVNSAVRATLASDGGLFMTGATSGSKGAGTINASAVYDDGVLLTCPALASEFLATGRIDTDYWDSLVPELVTPETRLTKPVMETIEIHERQYVDQGDGTHLVEVVSRTVERQAVDLSPVYDANGNGIDAVEVPVLGPEIVIPETRTKRSHRMAHLLKAMVAEGFDPRDPIAYINKLRGEEALPGMPTKANWEHGSHSMGEIHCRLWLATELLALVVVNLHDRVAALELKA